MAIPIIVPRLGWNMEHGVFVGWLKTDGAVVRPGESLFTLESDKSTEDVECLDAGILRIPPEGPKEGETLAVGAVIGYLLQPGETPPGSAPCSPGAPAAHAAKSLPPVAGPPAISPRAKRTARKLGVDWTTLHGTGRTGRIRECDIRAAARTSAPVPSAAPTAVGSIRRTIAERMLTSHRSTAPVTLTTTADATNLVNLRNQFKAAGRVGHDVVPSYTDFLVKLSALALAKHPALNARWDADQIEISTLIQIGIAVDTDAGLVVPVVHDVASLRLKQIALRARDLIERARQRKLSAKELQGGTFTITNLGALGIDTFTPIINYPECAILGVGRIQRRPVVVGEQMVPRDQLTLNLTFDHRIVDGAPAARFLQMLSGLIENPGPWLMT